MGAYLTDNFNRADDVDINASSAGKTENGAQGSWNYNDAVLGSMQIISNQLRQNTGQVDGYCVAELDYDLGSPDHFAQIDITTLTGTGNREYGALRVRSDIANNNGYMFRYQLRGGSGTLNYVLRKITGGSSVNLSTETAETISLPLTIRLEAKELGGGQTEIKAYINGQLKASATDSSTPYVNNKVAIEMREDSPGTVALDNFTTGTLSRTITETDGFSVSENIITDSPDKVVTDGINISETVTLIGGTNLLTDNFERSTFTGSATGKTENGGAASWDWSESFGTMKIASGLLQQDTGDVENKSVAELNYDLGSPNHFAQVDIVNLSGTGNRQYGALRVRYDSVSNNYYFFRYQLRSTGEFNFVLRKGVAGVSSDLATETAETISLPLKIRLEAENIGAGQVELRAYINGELKASAIDSSSPFTSPNRVGVEIRNDSGVVSLDDFEAGTIDEVYPGINWTFRDPALLGLRDSKFDSFVTALGAGSAGVIIKDGFLVKEWGDQDTKFDWGSARKTPLSMMLFFAVEESLLSTVNDLTRPFVQAMTSSDYITKDQGITFFHLANNISGYALPESPGDAWAYNDYGTTLHFKTLFTQVFGDTAENIIQNRLSKLKFHDGTLFTSRQGYGINTTPKDFARIGLFLLHKGKWIDSQLVPSSYFDTYYKPHVKNSLPRSSGSDTPGALDYLGTGSVGGGANQQALGAGLYGWNTWFNGFVNETGNRAWDALPRDAFQANGHWDQEVVLVVPSLDLVVAAKGTWGDFNLGNPASDTNANLKLLMDALGAEVDEFILSESLTVEKAKSDTDSLSIFSEEIIINKEINLSENLFTAENEIINKDFSLSEQIDIAEQEVLNKDNTFTLSDSIALNDTVQIDVSITIQESISLDDSIQKTDKELSLQETLSAADDIQLQFAKTVSVNDSISVSEVVSIEKAFTLSESLSIADAADIETSGEISVTDNVNVTDAEIISKENVLQDNLNLTENVTIEKAFNETDSAALSDDMLINKDAVLIDAISAADNILIEKEFVISDNASVSDAVEVDGSNEIDVTENININDSTALDKDESLSDALSLAENILIEKSFAESESSQVSESLFVDKDGNLVEVISFGENIVIEKELSLDEDLLFSDTVEVSGPTAIFLTDNISVNEADAIDKAAVLTETFLITDAIISSEIIHSLLFLESKIQNILFIESRINDDN